MYGIYANIGGILMGSMLPYIAYMDPMGYRGFSSHVDSQRVVLLRMCPGMLPTRKSQAAVIRNRDLDTATGMKMAT
jgi:hypothetical protein